MAAVSADNQFVVKEYHPTGKRVEPEELAGQA